MRTFVARNVDRADERNPEVPKELRVHERRYKATGGRIDVNMNVQTIGLILRFQKVIESLHRYHGSQQNGIGDDQTKE